MTGPQLDGPAVTIERAGELLHCKKTRVYELIAEKKLVLAPKFGRKTTVTTESVLALLEAPEPERLKKSKRPPRSSAEFRAELQSVKW